MHSVVMRVRLWYCVVLYASASAPFCDAIFFVLSEPGNDISHEARSRSVSAKTLKHRDTYTALRHFQYHPDLWTLQMPRSYY